MRWIPLGVAGLHTALVLAAVVLISVNEDPTGEITMLWWLFLYIDFPLGWLLIPIEMSVGPVFHDSLGLWARVILLPAVIFGIFGGIQYFGMTWLACWRWQRVWPSKSRPEAEPSRLKVR